MAVRAAFLIAFLAGFLSLGATIDAGVMAKHLPTTKTLQGEAEGALNGFMGRLESAKEKIPAGMEDKWDQCVEDNKEQVGYVFQLLGEIDVILQYYDITGGSEESLDNFHAWLKDFENKYPEMLKSVESCFTKARVGALDTQNSQETEVKSD